MPRKVVMILCHRHPESSANLRWKQFMTQAEAEVIALKAIEWMATDGTLFAGFLNITGETAEGIRQRLHDAELLAAAMDHLLSSDDTVVGFCNASNLPLELPSAVRRALPGGEVPEWT